MSSAWFDKRSLVIKRCNNVCEGCGLNDVNEVHHRHYDRVGYEFLFDLIGLCRECHDKLHRYEKAARGRVYRPDPSSWVSDA
jgi:5-methylcytosine-specific restriction endonuclease McrA